MRPARSEAAVAPATTPREVQLVEIVDKADELDRAARCLYFATGFATDIAPLDREGTEALHWLATEVTGRADQLLEALLALSNRPGPQLAG